MPGRKVKFRHPDTGEETQGHLHATGPVGATVVDGRGAVHKVPHGHYMHADEAGPGDGDQGDDKPSAAVVKKAALKHLELGADQPLAVYAAAALLSKKLGGVEHAHDLKSEEVTIANPYARVERGKLQTDLEPLVKTLAALKKKTPSGPLFVVDGKPITADALTLYVQRFGTPGKGVGGRDVRPANPGDGEPMAKAAASALDLPVLGEAESEWEHLGYHCSFHKGDHGLGHLMIEGPNMPLPLHEVVGNAIAARAVASLVVANLRAGKAPGRGVFQAVR